MVEFLNEIPNLSGIIIGFIIGIVISLAFSKRKK